MGSRGPKPAPKVLAAANRILLAEAARGSLSAKEAMIATGLYTEEECTDSAQRAVRKQAQTLRNRARQNEHNDDALVGQHRARASKAKARPTAKAKTKTKAAERSLVVKRGTSKRPRREGEPIRNEQPAPVPYRRSSSQVVQQQAADNRQQRVYDKAMVEATSLYAEEKQKPKDDRLSSAEIAAMMREKHTVAIPPSSIRHRVSNNRAGEPNDRRGPLGLISDDHFKLICELVSTDIMLTQASSKPDLEAPDIKKKLERLLRGSGTPAESMNVDALYARIRSKISEFVSARSTNNVELRRQLWLSDSNFDVWFDSWKSVLVSLGFAKDEPMVDEEGRALSEVTLHPGQDRRILNFDESRICLDGTADSPGGRPPLMENDRRALLAYGS